MTEEIEKKKKLKESSLLMGNVKVTELDITGKENLSDSTNLDVNNSKKSDND